MSDRPIDKIPAAIIMACEQDFAESNNLLDTLLGGMRRDINARPERMEQPVDSDDSAYAVSLATNVLNLFSEYTLRMLCAAALYRLARQPASGDPLEELLKGEHRGQ